MIFYNPHQRVSALDLAHSKILPKLDRCWRVYRYEQSRSLKSHVRLYACSKCGKLPLWTRTLTGMSCAALSSFSRRRRTYFACKKTCSARCSENDRRAHASFFFWFPPVFFTPYCSWYCSAPTLTKIKSRLLGTYCFWFGIRDRDCILYIVDSDQRFVTQARLACIFCPLFQRPLPAACVALWTLICTHIANFLNHQ